MELLLICDLKICKCAVLSFKLVPLIPELFVSTGGDTLFQYLSLALPWLATWSIFCGTSKPCMVSHIITSYSMAAMLQLRHLLKP